MKTVEVILKKNKTKASRFSEFRKSEDGNIAIIFVFMLGVLLLFAGGGVDYTRFNSVRAEAIQSLDAAALAISQYDELGGPLLDGLEGEERNNALEMFGENFFFSNFTQEDLFENGIVNVEFTVNSSIIRARASGNVQTLLLHVGRKLVSGGAGNNGSIEANLSLDTEVVVTRRGSGFFELALVLDSTGSMSRNAQGNSTSNDAERKITGLKNAVDGLLDILYGPGQNIVNPAVQVGIVPFNAYVNVGDEASGQFQDEWLDADALATYHGHNFVHVGEDGLVDLTRKVNHFDLHNSVPNNDWSGCVEARPFPLDEIDTPPGVTISASDLEDFLDKPVGPNAITEIVDAFDDAPDYALSLNEIGNEDNSRWIPLFRPDEPDCDNTCSGSSQRTRDINIQGTDVEISYNGVWFDDPRDSPYNYTLGDYNNETFISDGLYADDDNSDVAARYAFYDLQRRTAAEAVNNNNETQAQRDLYDRYTELGANEPGNVSAWDRRNRAEFISRQAYPGWYNETTGEYDYKYDLANGIDEVVTLSNSTTRGPNRGCPAPVLPLTDRKADIEDHMDLVLPVGNTNIANGAIWGMRLLSDAEPFTQGVDYGTLGWQKAVVIMTDGDQFISSFDTHFRSEHTAYGYAIEERMGENIDTRNEMRDLLDDKLLRTCFRMKQRGILVYTVVFGDLSSGTEQTMRACASETENGADKEGQFYFEAVTNEQLVSAFAGIGQNLRETHISQ